MRDPSKFRLHFKEYKDGKSVREIYGLPGYYDGKEAEEVSDDTYRFIRKHEGFAKTLTPDPGNGLMFIGSGLSGKKYIDAFKAKGVWTEVDNMRAIKEVVRQNRSYIRAIFGERYNHLTDDQKKVIDDIAFNIGVGNLTKEKAPKFVAAVLAGDDATAKKEINWGDKLKDIYGNPLTGVLNRNIERRMLWGGRKNMPEWKAPRIISKPDATRVATTIPQEKTIPIADPRNATIAEALRAMWAHTAFENIPKISDMPIWESPSLPALTPVEYDVTPLKTYSKGKLPGYLKGLTQLQIEETIVKNQGTIQQGHRWSGASLARRLLRHNANDSELVRMLKSNGNYFYDLIAEGGPLDLVVPIIPIVRSAKNIAENHGDASDVINIGLGFASLGAEGKAVKDAVKRVTKSPKPTNASTKKVLSAQEVSEDLTIKPKTRIDPKKYKQQTEYTLKITDQKTQKYNKTKLPSKEPVLNSADFPENTNINALYGPEGMLFSNKIVNNDRLMDIAVPHEFKHYLQLYYNYTPELAMIMERAFPFSEKFIKEHPDFNFVKEGGAMLSELEYEIGKRYGFPVGKDFEDVVNRITPAEIEDMASKLSVYNRDASEQRIKHFGMPDVMALTPEQAHFYNNFKDMLLKVPVVAGGTMVVPKDKQYKNGKLPGYWSGKFSILPAWLFVRTIGQKLRDRMYRTVTPSNYHEDQIVNFIKGKKRLRYLDPNTEAAYGVYTKLDSIDTQQYEDFLKKNKIPHRVLSKNEQDKLIGSSEELGYDPDSVVRVAVKDLIRPSSKKEGAYEFVYPNLPGQWPLVPKGKDGDSSWQHSHPLGWYERGTNSDDNGTYDWYKDKWDINPFKGTSAKDDGSKIFKFGQSVGLDYFDDIVPWGNPFDIYGTVYQNNNNADTTPTKDKYKLFGSYKDGKISIKPSKRGTFTAAAKKHGASVREFESRVLKNPEKYSKAMVRKALFSRNARSWKH